MWYTDSVNAVTEKSTTVRFAQRVGGWCKSHGAAGGSHSQRCGGSGIFPCVVRNGAAVIGKRVCAQGMLMRA